jgi:hypothetical protein
MYRRYLMQMLYFRLYLVRHPPHPPAQCTAETSHPIPVLIPGSMSQPSIIFSFSSHCLFSLFFPSAPSSSHRSRYPQPPLLSLSLPASFLLSAAPHRPFRPAAHPSIALWGCTCTTTLVQHHLQTTGYLLSRPQPHTRCARLL